MNTDDYINQVFTEHLLINDYKKLTEPEATEYINSTKTTLKQLFLANKNLLSNPEIIYFEWSFKQKHRTLIFYGIPKIH